LMRKYILWLGENHPVKFANVFTVIEDFDYPVPEEVKNNPAYQKVKSQENDTESAKAAHQMIEDYEWPEQLLRPIARAERMNQLAEGILRKAFQDIERLAEQGPGSISWTYFLREMEDIAEEAIKNIGERIEVKYLNDFVLLDLWREGRRRAGAKVAERWPAYRDRIGTGEAMDELRQHGQSDPALEQFGIFKSDFDLMRSIQEAAKNTWRNYEKGWRSKPAVKPIGSFAGTMTALPEGWLPVVLSRLSSPNLSQFLKTVSPYRFLQFVQGLKVSLGITIGRRAILGAA